MYKLETKIEADLEEEWNLIKNIKKFLIELGCITESDSKKDAVFLSVEIWLVLIVLFLLNKKRIRLYVLRSSILKNDVDYFSAKFFWIAFSLE
ncbi:MAG: hypothetical protein L6U99_06550 [Clostridium sp.]|nr:MAG: hypothetical protein L6U99_06550 [Clostridium sp.]